MINNKTNEFGMFFRLFEELDFLNKMLERHIRRLRETVTLFYEFNLLSTITLLISCNVLVYIIDCCSLL